MVMPVVPEISLATFVVYPITSDDHEKIDTPNTYEKKLEAREDSVF